jgi:hypothetical protein
MDARALIQQQLSLSHRFIKQCIGDISDDEARRMPSATLSPIIWQVGHLAVVNVNFTQRTGTAPAASLPPAYPDLFKKGTGGKADYPHFDEVTRALDATHDALMRAVAEADLDAPHEGRPGAWSNVGEMLGYSNTHRWYHIGKIASLRAMLGKSRVLG